MKGLGMATPAHRRVQKKKKKTEPGELAQWALVTVGRAAGLKTRELKRTKNMTMMEKKAQPEWKE